jgi:hypothetical protein
MPHGIILRERAPVDAPHRPASNSLRRADRTEDRAALPGKSRSILCPCGLAGTEGLESRLRNDRRYEVPLEDGHDYGPCDFRGS